MRRSPLLLRVDEQDLKRALMAYVDNAGYDMEAGDVIEFTVKAAVAPGFEDTGKGDFVYTYEVE